MVHLKRNWEAMVERGGAARRVGEGCLAVHRQVFELWHRFRGGGCTRPELGERIEPLIEALTEVLGSGTRCRDAKTRRACARLIEESAGLWTFVGTEGVEPTNNHAERVLRRAVLWRKRSFGCPSALGCRFVERIWTVMQSLRLQQRNAIAFRTQAIAAHRSGQPGPALVAGG
jgi:transposase